MTTINNGYINALLADATYALKEGSRPDGYTSAELKALETLKTRMTPAQAKFIGDNFEVVTHIDSDDYFFSGFDATVWRDINSGQTYVTMRGSDGLQDFIGANLDLTLSGAAREQIQDMVNWWLQNTTASGQSAPQIRFTGGVFVSADPVDGTGILSDVSSVNVNGHSLGGHLATAFSRLFGGSLTVEHTYTYNSAGFNPVSEIIFDDIEDLLDAGTSTGRFPTESEQSNFYAENGISVATQNLTGGQQGKRIALFNEEGTLLPNHSMYKLTDSLALGSIFEAIDSTFNFSKMNTLFEQSSNNPEASLEKALDALRYLFLGEGEIATPVGDSGDDLFSRKTYHNNLYALKTLLFTDPDKLQLEKKPEYQNLQIVDTNSLSSYGDSDSVSGLAYRYALLNLNSFSMLGGSDLYNQHNAIDQLSAENFSDQYLKDRSKFLSLTQTQNAKDITSIPTVISQNDDIAEIFTDKSTSQEIQTFASSPEADRIVFGAYDEDTIDGGDGNDRLYGMGEADILNGLTGDDYLEGGAGNDIYFIDYNDDATLTERDTILDNQGPNNNIKVQYESGGIYVNLLGTTVTLLAKNGKSFYAELDVNGDPVNDLQYYFSGNDLKIVTKNSANIITVKDFVPDSQVDKNANNFGITFADNEIDQTPETDFSVTSLGSSGIWSDAFQRTVWNDQPGDPDWSSVGIKLDGAVVDLKNTNAIDYGRTGGHFGGGVNDDHLIGNNFQNSFSGFSGNDYIEGISDFNSLSGGSGSDIILGGTGEDIIWGSTSVSQYTLVEDLIVNGDPAYGHSAAEYYGYYLPQLKDTLDDINVLDGGAGNDHISGGEYTDIIVGGTGINFLYGNTGNDLIEGGAEHDEIFGDSSHNVIWSTTNESNIFDPEFWITKYQVVFADGTDDVQLYNDNIVAGGGQDIVWGELGNDAIYGEAGDDILYGDRVYDPAYFDALFNGTPVNSRLFEAYDGVSPDLAVALHGNDYIEGGAGNDVIRGNGGDDVLRGGDDVDILYGDDEFIAVENHGDDKLYGDEGGDYLYGGGGKDELHGGAAIDYLYGQNGDDTIYGDAGNDIAAGGEGKDKLYGGSGIDNLHGENGNDILVGGSDNDNLLGGDGDDSYLYSNGDGLDYIWDADGSNTLVIQGVSQSELSIVFQNGAALVGYHDSVKGWQGVRTSASDFGLLDIAIGESGSVIEKSQFKRLYLDSQGNELLSIDAANGYTFEELEAIARVAPGGDQADLIFGGIVSNLFVEDSLNDDGSYTITLPGLPGIYINVQADKLNSAVNIAELVDGATINYNIRNKDGFITGSDRNEIFQLTGTDSIVAARGGNDQIYGSNGVDEIYGEGGSDFIDGGTGNDILNGGSGNDTYSFSLGDGVDKLDDELGTHSFEFDNTVNSNDIHLLFGSTNIEDFHLYYSNEDYIRSPGASGYVSAFDIYDVKYQGVSIDLVQRSSLENGFLFDTRANDIFEGGTGNDTYNISGWGDDVFRFSSGDGADVIEVGDSFYPEKRGIIEFGENVSTDSISFEFQGSSAIVNYGDGDTITINLETVHILPGPFYPNPENALNSFNFVSKNDLQWKPIINASGAHLETFGSYGDDIIFGTDGVNNILPGYGNDYIAAGDGDDNIFLNKLLYSSANKSEYGHKTIAGNTGNDSTHSFLYQGMTYQYNAGDGDDSIEYDLSYSYQHPYDFQLDFDAGSVDFVPSGDDVIEFGEGISQEDLRFTRFEDNLEITFINQAGSISVENFFFAYDSGEPQPSENFINQFVDGGNPNLFDNGGVQSILPKVPIARLDFYGGGSFDMTTQLDAVLVNAPDNINILGTNEGDFLVGDQQGTTDDVIYGLGGSDDIEDYSGNNQIHAGSGNDFVYLGGGNNFINLGSGIDNLGLEEGIHKVVFEYGAGTNYVWVNEPSAQQLDIQLGVGISLNDINVEILDEVEDFVGDVVSGPLYKLSLAGSGDVTYVLSTSYQADPSLRQIDSLIDSIIFSDSSTTTIEDLLNNAGNANPIASDDSGTTNEDTAKVFTVAELLSNDSDVDGDSLSITGVSNASNGSVSFNSTDQTITFTPDADYHGPASFDYTLGDGSATDTGTVNLTVDPVNDAPVANDDSAMGTEDTDVVLTFAELLANDDDVDGDTLTITDVSNEVNGSVSINSIAETITFTPDAGYNGPASFDYDVNDGTETTTASVNLTIGAENDAPVATDDAGSTNEDQAKVFTVAELLSNDNDVDGDLLSITGVSNASNGNVVFDSVAGEITFTPDADYHGAASFDYTLSDGTVTDTGTVNLTIDPINDAPIADNDSATGTEDTDVVLTFAELLANDSDVDGDALTISGVSNASNGSVSIDATAETITFTPDAGYSGAASFDYTLVQADGAAVDTAVVNITISPSDPVTNYITGTSASQTLNGTDGNDVIDGLAGNDVINAGLGDDILIGGTGYDELYGGAGDDTFIVDAADTSADRTYGGEGFDRIVAGDGDDTIWIRFLTDSYSIEQIDGGSGVNRIQGSNYTNYLDFSSVELVNIEHTFVGGGGDDTIIGTSSDDTLIGGTGYDKLYGGAGDDTFIVDAADTSADLRTGGEGFDRIVAGDGDDNIRIRYLTASYGIEQIDGGLGTNTIVGTTMRDVWDFSTVELINIEHTFDGGNGDDKITGTSGDDILIGGKGYDELYGGAGDDTFIVDAADTSADLRTGGEGFDRIVAGDGDDTIRIRYLTGSYSIEQIDGGLGTNTIVGTTMRDVWDFSTVELINIEHTFDGGNGDDKITGTSGDDILIGGTGYDELYGGAGDDTFIVDAADTSADRTYGGEGFDRIVAGDGDDTIRIRYLTESYSIEQIDGGLGTNAIIATSAGDALDFSGTELLNITSINGAAGHDNIIGSSSDDLIIGGTGNDALRGGAGNDTYQFFSGDGHDTINNIGADVTEVDSLLFDDVANDELWLSKSGDNLIVDVVGTDDWVKISDWYADDSNQLDTIEASNLLLHRDQVDQLVNAMAAFDVPDGVGAVVPEDVRQQLEPTLTTVWQVS